MKVKVLSLLVPALLVAGAANAAEIYNKDGNKLDLYGKIDGLHYFSDDKSVDGDQTYMRVGVKGETQINDQLTGYGQWEYNVQANNTESSSDQAWTRLAFAGLKFGDAGSFDYGRNYGVVYDVTSWTDVLPEFGGDTYGSDNFLQSRANGVATISRYLVSVGGALVSRGMNGEGKPWRVAIQKPTDRENAVQAIVDINGHGISTSGSYRNYYELDGKRISHVIDPQTGQPITHKLVSVTVIAPTALEADGWDTGLMVLGPEKAQQVVREEGLAVYMIVKEGEGFKTWMSPQFRTFLVGEKN
ncbi:porin [Klebsiella sp. KP20-425-1]|uniref:porin n=1 Tax=Klebsiella sp. KP20-425-1 TaxID=2986524 RepID=UPI002265AC4C|nr:porin [Klebsiella sp. KP20-425-1]